MSNTDKAARVLFEHDAERMECADHDRYCCPTCDAHGYSDDYGHQAQALLAAGLLRRDTVADFGLSKVEVTTIFEGPTHVLIEAGGVPVVSGYIEHPHKPLPMPLLTSALDGAPRTAAVVEQIAATAPGGPYSLEGINPSWSALVVQYAERESRARELADTLDAAASADETSAYDADLLRTVLGRLRDALDPPAEIVEEDQ